MTNADWAQARNVLCIRLDYLGDVLMMTPAIRALKHPQHSQHSPPGRRITLLTSAAGAAAASYIPEIDDTIEYAAPWMKSSGFHSAVADLVMISALRERQFEAAVIFTTYSQSALPAALLCYLAGIPLRLAHCRENPYQLLTHWVRDTEPQEHVRHEVQRQLDLVATVGCHTRDERLSFRVAASDLAWVLHRLQGLGVDPSRPWILLHPGASAPSRRYPPRHWTCAAQELKRRLACPLVFSGDPHEVELVDQIRHGIAGSHSLAGELDLGKLAALISLAPVFIVNNTGPAHIAAAVGTPLVDLYALTNPQHTPWQVASRVLFQEVPCSFCYKSICPKGHHDCLSRVAPERVVDAAIELLQTASAPGRAVGAGVG